MWAFLSFAQNELCYNKNNTCYKQTREKGTGINFMKTTIQEKVIQLQPTLIRAIQQQVAIPSVIGEAKEGAPFGQAIAQSLETMLNLCESLGFTVKNGEGYYGYAEIGEGSETLGILGHLDVVPVGDLANWHHDPFDCQINDGKLIGRGTQDDKGPTLAALYAVKALIDSGVTFNKKIRFIFGTDEETLWRDMAKYRENGETIPDFGFTPDSKFPMINAEKGLLQAVLKTTNPAPVKLIAGNAFNSVPDQAEYTGEKQAEVKTALSKHNFQFKETATSVLVLGTGIHSQAADRGENAISRLAISLHEVGLHCEAIDFIAEVIGEDANANQIIANCEDEVSGKLTVNIGKVRLDETGQEIALDIRIPVSYEKATIVEPLQAIAQKYALSYEEFDWLAAIHVPTDHFLVKTLRDVYETETGLDSTPESSGGATFARALDNCVAFGMVFPDSVKTEHQPNEYITLADLEKATQIYAQAIYQLVK